MSTGEILGLTLDQLDMYLSGRKRVLFESQYGALRLSYAFESYVAAMGKGYVPEWDEWLPSFLNVNDGVQRGPYSRALVRDFVELMRLGLVRNAALDWFDVELLSKSGLRELSRGE